MTKNRASFIHTAAALVAGAFLLIAAPAFADTSLNIQSLSPGASVTAGSQLTFTAVPSGLNANVTYSLTDPFSGTTISSSNINGSGTLYWTPTTADIGTHTITVTASDNSGSTVSKAQQIVVNPLPTVAIQSISPATNPPVGATVTFTAVPTGFTGVSYLYSLSDTDPETTITSSNIDSTGHFSWVPKSSELGLHTITVTVSGGGITATKTQQFVVGGDTPLPGSTSTTAAASSAGTLSIGYLRPAVGVGIGTNVTIGVTASGFTPTNYTVADSFAPDSGGIISSVTSANVNSSGSFAWTPNSGDVGTHILTFTATNSTGGTATITATVIVLASLPAITTPAVTTPVVTAPAPVTTTPAPVTTSAPSYVFSTLLQSGSTGADVIALQTILVRLGYLSATPSGTYGPQTTAAVKQYQIAHGLSPLGIVGPGTRAALNAEAGTSVTTTTPAVTTTTSVGMSASTKLVLLQIAQQLQQLAAQLAALAS